MICILAAVHGEYAAPPVSGDLYADQDWNETSSIKNGQAYHLSKVQASIVHHVQQHCTCYYLHFARDSHRESDAQFLEVDSMTGRATGTF